MDPGGEEVPGPRDVLAKSLPRAQHRDRLTRQRLDRVSDAQSVQDGERDDLVLCDDARAAIEGADALVVVTEWKQFRSPDFARLQETLGDAVVFDGRNLYDPAEVEAAGLAYYGIGRGRSVKARVTG